MTDLCCASTERRPVLRRALRLEYLTVGWNLAEGAIAVSAALLAGSVALLGFGIDSFVESASGLVLIWRLRAEHRDMMWLARAKRRAAHQLDSRALEADAFRRLRRWWADPVAAFAMTSLLVREGKETRRELLSVGGRQQRTPTRGIGVQAHPPPSGRPPACTRASGCRDTPTGEAP